jgi:hypothetical protein
MATMFAQFQCLSAQAQYATVYWEGHTISQRQVGEDTVKLLEMAGGFYAEVGYDQAQRALCFVSAFLPDEHSRLLPYWRVERDP